MSLSSLFKNKKDSGKRIAPISTDEMGSEASGRGDFSKATIKKYSRYVPPVDLSDPANFAKYGSAEQYYSSSIQSIYNDYPYDGSKAEKIEWENNITYLDLYLFENEYPRTNGYVYFSPSGWGDVSSTSRYSGIGLPEDREFILIDGGPNADSGYYYTKAKSKANIYNVNHNRESNLRLNLASGSTVEFWLRIPELVPSSDTSGTILFDMWNGATASSETYGRFNVMLVNHNLPDTGYIYSGSAFAIQCVSGAAGFQKGFTIGNGTLPGNASHHYPAIFPTVPSSSIADNLWHHYAFVVENTGSDIKATMYRDGAFVSTYTREDNSIGEVTGALQATLGSYVAWPEYADDPGTGGSVNGRGSGKFSGSMDEFRFWKTARTEKQILDNYIIPIGGGTNKAKYDTLFNNSNTDLGVYYKFNEGIAENATTDATVLDYSGRIGNGTWTVDAGMNGAIYRSTGSAFVDSGVATSEFKDPIIYSFHPEVSNLLNSKCASGSAHDKKNVSMLLRRFPSYLVEQDRETNNVLRDLTQIISSYLDTVNMQIEYLPRLQEKGYFSGSQKPNKFAYHSLLSKGLNVPDTFVDADLINRFLGKTEDIVFEENLEDIKNTIYRNIYNNLENIYKAKGTAKSFLKLLRCYGVDDSLISLNLYSNNAVFPIRHRTKNTSTKVNSVDFYNFKTASFFQSASLHNTDGSSYISASGEEHLGYAFTYEADVFFPKIQVRSESYLTNFSPITASVFGLHGSKDYVGFDDDDYSNFVVLTERKSENSRDAKFVLTGADGSNSIIGELGLTSSYIGDVFDGTRWKLMVRMKPNTYPTFNTIVGDTGSVPSSGSYLVEFVGLNVVDNTIVNSFEVSSTVLSASAKRMLSDENKRVFVGAHRQDFTGSLLRQADSKLFGCRSWASYVDTETAVSAALDPRSYGTRNPHEGAYLFQEKTKANQVEYVPNTKTLLLNWDFEGITGSDASGQISVFDFASGSTAIGQTYATLGGVFNKKYTGVGINFPSGSTSFIKSLEFPALKPAGPREVASDDLVRVLDDDDVATNKHYMPADFVFAIEKSPYNAVNQEILNLFADISDFSNLYARPVDKFRPNYKKLEYLRSRFFERLQNDVSVEKFLDYYIWLDESLNEVIEQLIPLGSDVIGKVNNTVKSHVLEQNKYHWKYSAVTNKKLEPSGSVHGIVEANYSWKFGHAPLNPDQNTNQNENCLWWKERAGRTTALTSGDSSLDGDKQKILEVIQTHVSGSTFALRQFPRVYKFDADPEQIIEGGHNSFGTVKPNLFKDTLLNQETTTMDTFGQVYLNIDASEFLGCNDEIDPNKRVKYSTEADFTGAGALTYGLNELDGPGRLLSPISIVSSSLSLGGYAAAVSITPDVQINGLHQDVVGDDLHIPMQSPFTDEHVGGKEERHQPLNAGSDGSSNRAEGFDLVTAASRISYRSMKNSTSNNPPARWFRNVRVKRPVNLRNIQSTTGSTVLGNYSKKYEYVQTTGRQEQRPFFRKATNSENLGNPTTDLGLDSTKPIPELTLNVPPADSIKHTLSNLTDRLSSTPEAVQGAGTFRSLLDRTYVTPTGTTVTDSERNQTVFVGRFSAPGGYEVMSRGFLDPETETFSSYNALPWRNATIRRELNAKDRTFCAQFGFQGRSHLTGIIDVTAPNIDPFEGVVTSSIDSIITASHHKVNRNASYRYVRTSDPYNVITASLFDNGFMSRPIPQSDRQYSWITASIVRKIGIRFPVMAPLGEMAPLGYATSSTDITFLSASELGTFNNTADEEVRYAFKEEGVGTMTAWTPNTFAGLNFTTLDRWRVVDTNQGGVGDNVILGGGWFPSGWDQATDTRAMGALAYANSNAVSNAGAAIYAAFVAVEGPDSGYAQNRMLNATIHHRQGPYGWPTWKQIRVGETSIARYLKTSNKYQTTDLQESTALGKNQRSFVYRYERRREPPITAKYLPTTFNLNILKGNATDVTEKDVMTSFNNTFSYFSNTTLNEKFDISEQQKADDSYDRYFGGILSLNNSSFPINILDYTYQEVIYPRARYTFLSGSRKRGHSPVTFWRDKRGDRIKKGKDNYLGYGGSTVNLNKLTSSIWPMDARTDFATSDPEWWGTVWPGPGNPYASPGRGEGELQSVHWLFHYSLTANPVFQNSNTSLFSNYHLQIPGPSACYNRSFLCSASLHRATYAAASPSGQAAWEAGANSGAPVPAPFYDTYEEYADDLMRVGKDFTIVPEYRISEHMSEYLDKESDFLTTVNNFLTLTGSALSASDNSGFERTYINSDFMKFFGATFEKINPSGQTSLNLTCETLMKFLPYEGFYPQERTLQLAQALSSSFFGTKQHTNDESMPKIFLRGSEASFRTAVAPLYAPGIMYNTIKSGLAVGYPLHTKAITYTTGAAASPADGTGEIFDSVGITRLTKPPDEYIPFEAIIDLAALKGKKIVDPEPDVKTRLNSTASYLGETDPQYSLAVNNFLASTIDFYLKDSTLSTFVSKPEDQFETFDSGRTYGMDIVLRNGIYATEEAVRKNPFNSTAGGLQSGSLSFNPLSVLNYGHTGSRVDTAGAEIANTEGAFWGASFGPPSVLPVSSSAHPMYYEHCTYTPYTPSYYNGYSRIRIKFTPPDSGPQALSTILNSGHTTFESYRFGDKQDAVSSGIDGTAAMAIYSASMHLSESVNYNQTTKATNFSSTPAGQILSFEPSDSNVWVIQTKFECPVLNFKGATKTLPAVSGTQTPTGMWHQYGTVPAADQGIRFEIQDIPDEVTDSDGDKFLSLATAVGMASARAPQGGARTTDALSTKIGKLPQTRAVAEGIVAIPYYVDEIGLEAYFPISRDKIDAGLMELGMPDKLSPGVVPASVPNALGQPGTYIDDNGTPISLTVLQMIRRMNKFIIPPKYDFINNPTINLGVPFAMYIFQFEHIFDRKDLQNMWQGIMPPSLSKIKEPRETVDTISHVLDPTQLLSLGYTVSQEQEELAVTPTGEIVTVPSGVFVTEKIPGVSSKIRWKVFKVKQRGKFNYYSQTAGTADDAKFQFNFGTNPVTEPAYSYNWPYDFFSMIELAKVRASFTRESENIVEVASDDENLQALSGELEGFEGLQDALMGDKDGDKEVFTPLAIGYATGLAMGGTMEEEIIRDTIPAASSNEPVRLTTTAPDMGGPRSADTVVTSGVIRGTTQRVATGAGNITKRVTVVDQQQQAAQKTAPIVRKVVYPSAPAAQKTAPIVRKVVYPSAPTTQTGRTTGGGAPDGPKRNTGPGSR